MPKTNQPWRLFVDTGGTFTDCLAIAPDGRRLRRKVLSSDEAPLQAARLITNTAKGPLPPIQLRLGTTRGTNALLEQKGADVVFFVSGGFGDLLRIGDQRRPELFTLNVEKPPPLHAAVIEVPGRLDATGKEIEPVDLESVRSAAGQQFEKGRNVAAVCLLHSYQNGTHEQAVKSCLEAIGYEYITISSEIAPFIKAVPRAETVIVDAYLAPVLGEHLSQITSAIDEAGLRIMTSAGGLVSRNGYQPKDSLLSAPAGGIVGAAAVAMRAGLNRVIAFDMGGTSTDVSRIDGGFDYCQTHTVGRARLMAPAVKIETVAAGGGSICAMHDGFQHVGPESAGAQPGPACYGAGGPLTITDVNLLLGRLDLDSFNLPVHPDAAAERFAEMADPKAQSREDLLGQFLALANDRMASAIRRISVREGYDSADHALVAFGGAGGQHACAVAARLGMRRILFPADAGLLSAYGLEQARIERVHEVQVLMCGEEFAVRGEAVLTAAIADVAGKLRGEGVPNEAIIILKQTALMRFAGQESVVAVDFETLADLDGLFRQRYREIFGYVPDGRQVEVVNMRVLASSPESISTPETFTPDTTPPPGLKTRSFFGGEWMDLPVYQRDQLQPGHQLRGPALVADEFGTLIIERDWHGVVGTELSLLLDHQTVAEVDAHKAEASRELMENRLLNIAAEMGAQLERTAISTNIRERLDFSCALLDTDGRLIVNAPHIPVHLGALGVCVREVAARLPLEPGDVAVANHPACGGSHLPDVTLIAPVFSNDSKPLGYVANRAHHAEIGGIAPGSMSPAAKSLEEEGVVIAPQHLFRRGIAQWDNLRELFQNGKFPTRRLEENMADLQAQVAALRIGENSLRQMADEHGPASVHSAMQFVYGRAAAATERWLRDWDDRELRMVQSLDNGAELVVRIRVAGCRMVVDFTGTSPVAEGSLHATPAIVRSALVYVLRLLVGDSMPLNEGLLELVEIDLPECLLNPNFGEDPAIAPAVFGGNVEVSQRLVDALLLAFEAAACGQGTMNNFVMGDASRSYYETIGGGGGAGDGFAGASGIHVHMSNTAITDPEILEWRYPILLRKFALRNGSGGDGRWRGGDGLVREIEFLEPQSISLLGQNRTNGPAGLAGGETGSAGLQKIIRKDGSVEKLPFAAQVEAQAGDRLIIETPGGGGYGTPTGHP